VSIETAPKTIHPDDVDINPLKTIDSLDYLRLLPYIWADQCDRLERIK
jgi:hypothetical protein